MVYRGSSPGRHSGSEDVAAGGNFKGPLGLNLLHTVDGPLVDFIFIHGLGGGSRKTWSKSPRQQHFWPKEWLSRDSEFEHVRIHSFGYKADWSEKRESVLETHDFARSLLGDIDCNPDIRRSQVGLTAYNHLDTTLQHCRRKLSSLRTAWEVSLQKRCANLRNGIVFLRSAVVGLRSCKRRSGLEEPG